MIGKAKNVLRNAPLLGPLLRRFGENRYVKRLAKQSVAEIFTSYYTKNLWGSSESRSGHGSNLEATAQLRETLPAVWRELGVQTVLDVPCGDFFWMKEVDLEDFCYIGGDVVPDIIADNIGRYASGGVSFRQMDLIKGRLPRADLVFCRDCLVHFSHRHIAEALRNIQMSGAKWLMMTHYPASGTNEDIVTGQWRTLNFEQVPFHFPPPRLLVQELANPVVAAVTAGSNKQQAFSLLTKWPDKSLAVWALADLPDLAIMALEAQTSP